MSDDLDIISRVELGDRNAFAVLVDKYQVKVRGYCCNILGNEAEAEDAAQDAFIKAFNSLNRFKKNSSFSTWLFAITRNHCLDVLKKRARRKTESLDSLVEKEGARIERLFSTGDMSISIEDRELVQKLLDCINDDHREVLILREVQGFSYAEIGQILDCTEDAVRARLSRARAEIKDRFRHLLDPEAS